jgi:hypothetical protein
MYLITTLGGRTPNRNPKRNRPDHAPELPGSLAILRSRKSEAAWRNRPCSQPDLDTLHLAGLRCGLAGMEVSLLGYSIFWLTYRADR